MQPPPVSQSSSRQRNARRVVLWILGSLTVLVFGVVAVLIVMRVNLSRGNERQLAAIRAAGMPVNCAELDAWYPAVPAQDNAALVFLEAAVRLASLPDKRTNEVTAYRFPPAGEPIANPDLEWMRQYVSLNRDALQFARTGLRRAHSRYPVDLKPGYLALLPHLSRLRSLAQAARFSAETSVPAGQPREAVDSIELILGLGRSLEEEPLLLSFLVRLSLLQSAASTLERTLSAATLSEPDLARLASLLAEADRTNLLVRAFAGERAITLPLFRMSGADLRRALSVGGGGAGSPTPTGAAFQDLAIQTVGTTGVFERDMRFYLGAMGTNISIARLGPPETVRLPGAIEQQYQAARKRYCIFSAMLLPGIGKSATREAAGLASLRLAQTALAIERYRLANGRLPARLGDLAPRFLPSVLHDPFDGAPVRFKPFEKGYVVYSVGEDLKDDGGKERVTGTQRYGDKSNYDITFKVLR